MDDLVYPAVKGTALFRITSKKRLAEVLIAKLETLKLLCDGEDLYNCWTEEKKNGGTRDIEAPKPHLKTVQKRISTLLQGIEPPSYLMAPVKSRSYVTNAATHIGARQFRLLDIEDFFPSCTQKKVFWFFNTCMECSRDVSSILASLTTRNGRLPQGSPCSPFLAFYAYVDMWKEIACICENASNNITIYADDITVSGEIILGSDIWRIKQILFRHGHRFNTEKERSIVNRQIEITGAIVSFSTLLLPNRQHKKLSDCKIAREKARTPFAREKLDRAIRGRVAQAKQVLGHK